MFVQAHAFVLLAEGDGPQRALCMVPRAQRPLSQVLRMPRPLVLLQRLSAVPLESRTSRGVLGHPIHACLRPASDGMQADSPGICSGAADGVSGVAQRQQYMSGVPPSLSAGCLSDHWSGVISAAVLVCQDVSVAGFLVCADLRAFHRHRFISVGWL